jgi:hypothetical protein
VTGDLGEERNIADDANRAVEIFVQDISLQDRARDRIKEKKHEHAAVAD